MTETIDFPTIIPKFDTILARGLCIGVGTEDGQMCIEAAIALALGLPFNDEPKCVAPAVRRYKIALNDQAWSSPQARAKGLRNLGIAQIGSNGVVDDIEFSRRLAKKTIRVILPAMFRECFPGKQWAIDAANRCEAEGTRDSARDANRAADAAANAATYAATYAAAAAANAAANAATYATYAAADADADADAAYAVAAAAQYLSSTPDTYLLLSASLALDVLRELKSPGCAWIP